VQESDPADVRAAVISTLDAMGGMPHIELSEDEVAHIRHGRALTRDSGVSGTVALAVAGELVAIAHAADGQLRPRKVFV
jgi:hypothetical protein